MHWAFTVAGQSPDHTGFTKSFSSYLLRYTGPADLSRKSENFRHKNLSAFSCRIYLFQHLRNSSFHFINSNTSYTGSWISIRTYCHFTFSALLLMNNIYVMLTLREPRSVKIFVRKKSDTWNSCTVSHMHGSGIIPQIKESILHKCNNFRCP